MKKRFSNLQKLGLLAVVSVFFFACENPTEIGYDFQGDDLSKAYYTDTLNFSTSTVLSDSNVNGKSSFLMVGEADDPVFGKMRSVAAFQPALITSTAGTVIPLEFTETPIADSIRLRIIHTGVVFGDTLPKISIGIHRLKSSLSPTKNYNGDENIEYEATPLTKIRINSASFKTAKYDTTVAFYVTLPKSLMEELTAITPANTKDNTLFNNAFRGLAFVPDAGSKAIYAFNTGPYSETTCTLFAYWHYASSPTTSNVYRFDLSGSRTSQLSFAKKTPLHLLTKQNNELTSKQTNGKTYIQAGSGIGTKINLDAIKNLGANIKISKAILEFQLDKTTQSAQFPRIFTYVLGELNSKNQQLRNAANQLTYLTPIGIDLSGSPSTLIDSTNTISVDVTNYLQRIVNKSTTNNPLLMMPGSLTTTGNAILGNDYLRRAVLEKPKLKIYYTKK